MFPFGSSTAAIPTRRGSDDLKRANDTPFPAVTQEVSVMAAD